MQIINNQTWLDITCQETGSLVALFDMCMANDAGITDEPGSGDKAVVSGAVDKKRLQYLKDRNTIIGTRGDGSGAGIGFWTIGDDFIVS